MNTRHGGVRQTAVKICGLTREEDAAVAEQAGAQFLGAILASGPRLLTPDRAREVLGPRRPSIQRVGVFGEQREDELLAIAERIDLDVLQLHGARDEAAVTRIMSSGRTVWPVVRIAGATLPAEAPILAAITGHLVIDALVIGQLGGTGVSLDWSGLTDAISALRNDVPGVRLILAGGLKPQNVAQAMQLLSPDVVDVSSGVEVAPGIKDANQIQQFVAAAHAAAEKV